MVKNRVTALFKFASKRSIKKIEEIFQLPQREVYSPLKNEEKQALFLIIYR
jgi:hypothetical protein